MHIHFSTLGKNTWAVLRLLFYQPRYPSDPATFGQMTLSKFEDVIQQLHSNDPANVYVALKTVKNSIIGNRTKKEQYANSGIIQRYNSVWFSVHWWPSYVDRLLNGCSMQTGYAFGA